MSNQHLLYLSASSKTSDNPALSQSDEELIERFDRLKRSVSDQGSEETLHSEEVMKISRSRHFNVGGTSIEILEGQSFDRRSHQFNEKPKIELKLLDNSEDLYNIQVFGINEGHIRVLVPPNESKKLNVWTSKTEKSQVISLRKSWQPKTDTFQPKMDHPPAKISGNAKSNSIQSRADSNIRSMIQSKIQSNTMTNSNSSDKDEVDVEDDSSHIPSLQKPKEDTEDAIEKEAAKVFDRLDESRIRHAKDDSGYGQSEPSGMKSSKGSAKSKSKTLFKNISEKLNPKKKNPPTRGDNEKLNNFPDLPRVFEPLLALDLPIRKEPMNESQTEKPKNTSGKTKILLKNFSEKMNPKEQNRPRGDNEKLKKIPNLQIHKKPSNESKEEQAKTNYGMDNPTPAMLALMAKKDEEDDSAKNSLQTSSEESTIVGIPQHDYPPNKTFSYTKIITMNTNESYGKPPQ